MKRFLSILAVVCLVAVMAVPAFADEAFSVFGSWKFNETVVIPQFTETVNFTTADGIQYTSISKISSTRFAYVKEDGTSFSPYREGWVSATYQTINFGATSQTVSAEFYSWLVANATLMLCDGSSCPATDVNYDGICDDCGMPLTMSLRGYPPILSIWNKSTYPYGLLYLTNSGVPTLYFFDNPYVSLDGVDIRYNGGNFEVYTLTDNVWVHNRTGQGAVDFPDTQSGQILKLSHDLMYQDNVVMSADTSFFPMPLWEKVELVTQGEMVQTTATVAGAMKTLALCGVGLIALLVVLSLFGKRSLIPRR